MPKVSGGCPVVGWAPKVAARPAMPCSAHASMLCCAVPPAVLCRYCDYLMECQQRAGSLLHAAAPVPQPTAKRGSPGGRGGAKQRGGRGGGGGSSGPGQQLSAEEQQVAGRELEVSATCKEDVDVGHLRCGALPAALAA